MASLSDVLSTLQNGVVAINNFGIQLKTTLTRISTRFGNYLLLSGGTLTGDLAISKANPILSLDKTLSGQDSAVRGTLLGSTRWFVSLGNTTAETGANAGSDFTIYRYTDAGALIGAIFTIARSSGNATFTTSTVAISNTTAGGANLALTGDGGVTPNKFIRASAGNLDILNTGYSAVIASLTDAGEFSWTGSAWTAWTPTISAGTGALTTTSATGRYKQNGKTVHFCVSITITTNGTGGTNLAFTLPVTAQVGALPFPSFSGKEANITGKAVQGLVISSTVFAFQYYDATYPGVNGARFDISGTYEAT